MMAAKRPFLGLSLKALVLLPALVSTGALASAGPGLQNLGNTCYLNAQLQSAFHIPRVRKLVQAAGGGSDILTPHDTVYDEATCSPALLALARLFNDMEGSTGRAVSPQQFCRSLGIPTMEQQDSQEFWKLLLPTIQLPALTKLYSGKLDSYIQALDGSGRQRSRPEPFLDLSLDLPTGGGSVESSLHQLLGEPELLSAAEGNGWRPEKGEDPVDAYKGSRLTKELPSVLQLHLKRFQFDWETETMSKLNNPIAFPLSLQLPMGDEDVDEASCSYELQAVVVHSGQFGAGHYYTYVRPDVREDTWFRFNDHDVQEVSWNDVTNDAFGGLQSDGFHVSEEAPISKKKRNLFARILGAFRNKDSQRNRGPTMTYGFGGQTSSAYVLQYVRRCDIQELYG